MSLGNFVVPAILASIIFFLLWIRMAKVMDQALKEAREKKILIRVVIHAGVRTHRGQTGETFFLAWVMIDQEGNFFAPEEKKWRTLYPATTEETENIHMFLGAPKWSLVQNTEFFQVVMLDKFYTE